MIYLSLNFLVSHFHYNTVSYYDFILISLLINIYATTVFYQHDIYDTVYNTSILAGLIWWKIITLPLAERPILAEPNLSILHIQAWPREACWVLVIYQLAAFSDRSLCSHAFVTRPINRPTVHLTYSLYFYLSRVLSLLKLL
jgi:hypothetical protein